MFSIPALAKRKFRSFLFSPELLRLAPLLFVSSLEAGTRSERGPVLAECTVPPSGCGQVRCSAGLGGAPPDVVFTTFLRCSFIQL